MAYDIEVEIYNQTIEVEMTGATSWAAIVDKPTPAAENSFMVASSTLAWVVKTMAQVKTILALTFKDVTADAVQTPAFANPLALDGTLYKSFKVTVTASTTVNLTGVVDGDAGSIELIISGAGGYTITMGTMFTKKLGSDNFISWMKSGADILYTIIQKV